ncbi:alpha/beta hydrolase [Candidatus Nomurabacteria bacterium]|nr:alpha/beta hydrolase [Candidatus Nomurabacteria bacterium]
MAKTDILFIHGGMTFKTQADYLEYLSKFKSIYLEEKVTWSGKYLSDSLGNKFRVIRPNMPLKDNAKYEDWKIFFERHLPLLNKNYILIGNSLGGIFLAKYLSENKLKNKAKAVYMIAPPFDNTLSGEDLVGGFKLKSNLSLIHKNSDKIIFMFSTDDDCVPISHAEKYRKKLPESEINIYKNKKGHFQVSTFPEIVKLLKEDAKP